MLLLYAINKASPVDIYLKLMNEFIFFKKNIHGVWCQMSVTRISWRSGAGRGSGEAKIAGSGPEWGKCDSPIWLQREMGGFFFFIFFKNKNFKNIYPF